MPDISDSQAASLFVNGYNRLRTELSKKIVGQEDVIEQVFMPWLPEVTPCWRASPVWQKRCCQILRRRHPSDLPPYSVHARPHAGDITGTEIIQEASRPAPQDGVLARSYFLPDHPRGRNQPHTAQTQAALLEAMQEHSVTVGQETFSLPRPFFVLATQNPIEQEGTYPLPEAQKDRFLFLIKVAYPTRDDEREISPAPPPRRRNPSSPCSAARICSRHRRWRVACRCQIT